MSNTSHPNPYQLKPLIAFSPLSQTQTKSNSYNHNFSPQTPPYETKPINLATNSTPTHYNITIRTNSSQDQNFNSHNPTPPSPTQHSSSATTLPHKHCNHNNTICQPKLHPQPNTTPMTD